MRQSVLVVDDCAEIHDVVDVRLRPEGLTVHHALTAEDGMERALSLRPDLILLDVEMPERGGFQLCQDLKADPSTSHIPVIFLTGMSELTEKVRGFDLGAVDYVVKPFEPAELRARVRAALRTKRFQDLLAVRASVDGLTGLRNRTYFSERLEEEAAAAARYGRKVSVVLFDLDHFKNLNDSYGHPFGDLVLQRVGELLSESIRVTDAACRYGGEELALILTETDVQGAVTMAERLAARIRELPFTSRGQRVQVTTSAGCADTAGAGSPTASSLLDRADAALYEAKHAGRDCVRAAK